MRDFSTEAAKFKDKIKNLKVFLFDVDGILTTGHLYWAGEEVGFNRFFHARDGYGLKLLQMSGYKVGIVTGGDSIGVEKRFKDNLKLDYIFMGNEDKREAYLEILNEGYKDEEIFYMGDELFDVPLLKRAGFSATVPEASHEVREIVDYVTEKTSGMGCAREVIEIIRLSLNLPNPVPDFP